MGGRPQLAGRVLRLRKGSTKQGQPSVRECSVFASHVMRTHLGAEFVDPQHLVPLPPDFLAAMATAVAEEPRRPPHRSRGTGLDTTCTEGVLLRDLTQAPPPGCWLDDGSAQGQGPRYGRGRQPRTICVEIKPKWYLPPPLPTAATLLPDVACARGSGLLPPRQAMEGQGQAGEERCRFCQHQALKLAQGKVGCASRYCPLALYGARGGDALRVSDAIRGLLGASPSAALAWGFVA